MVALDYCPSKNMVKQRTSKYILELCILPAEDINSSLRELFMKYIMTDIFNQNIQFDASKNYFWKVKFLTWLLHSAPLLSH